MQLQGLLPHFSWCKIRSKNNQLYSPPRPGYGFAPFCFNSIPSSSLRLAPVWFRPIFHSLLTLSTCSPPARYGFDFLHRISIPIAPRYHLLWYGFKPSRTKTLSLHLVTLSLGYGFAPFCFNSIPSSSLPPHPGMVLTSCIAFPYPSRPVFTCFDKVSRFLEPKPYHPALFPPALIWSYSYASRMQGLPQNAITEATRFSCVL